MKQLKVIFFLYFSTLFISSSYSHTGTQDSSNVSDQKIDSLPSIDSIVIFKRVPGKNNTYDSSHGNPHNLIVVDGVYARNPMTIYSYALYVGGILDINAKKIKNGGVGITLGYRRLFEFNESWGINFLSSLTVFYNACEDRYYFGEIPEESNSRDKFTENYFTFSLHLAPSFSTGYREIFYAGLGVTYLKGRVFENSVTGPYLIHADYNERVLFSQIVEIEKEVMPYLYFSLEYSRTKYNDYASIKIGKRF